MAKLLLNLPDDWVNALDELATDKTISRTELLRTFIADGLSDYELSEPQSRGKWERTESHRKLMSQLKQK